MKTCVVIPTFNESGAIGNLVSEIKEQGLEVVVIDDGSSDTTSQIAAEKGATVIRNSINEGKGASLKRGFRYALENDFEAVITLDGDGQHLPSDIPYFMRLAKYSSGGVFIGNRMLKVRTMPLLRIITNKVMSWFISSLIKQDVPDTQCGFRLIKREVLDKVKLETSKYETETEILIKSVRLGFRLESIPIKTVYKGEKSQINPFVDTFRFLKFITEDLWITRRQEKEWSKSKSPAGGSGQSAC